MLVLEAILSSFAVRRLEFGVCVNQNLRELTCPSLAFLLQDSLIMTCPSFCFPSYADFQEIPRTGFREALLANASFAITPSRVFKRLRPALQSN